MKKIQPKKTEPKKKAKPDRNPNPAELNHQMLPERHERLGNVDNVGMVVRSIGGKIVPVKPVEIVCD